MSGLVISNVSVILPRLSLDTQLVTLQLHQNSRLDAYFFLNACVKNVDTDLYQADS